MTASSEQVTRQEFDTFKRETHTVAERTDIRLQVMSMDLLSLNRHAADHEEGIGQLRAEVGELRAEVGELRAEVGELRAEVGELRAEVRGMNVRLDANERRLDELHEAFMTLSKNMEQGFAALTSMILQLPKR